MFICKKYLHFYSIYYRVSLLKVLSLNFFVMTKLESFFRFEITQTTKVLLYKIKMGDGRRWLVEEKSDEGIILLYDQHDNVTKIRVLPDVLHITTVRGFVYIVQDKEGDGAEVTFRGPVNALLTQSLLPRMTYVPQTLKGMTSDMPEYVPIAEFMQLREKRHNGNENPQDLHGWRVNMNFNNELVPWLPPFNGNMRAKPKEKQRAGKFPRK